MLLLPAIPPSPEEYLPGENNHSEETHSHKIIATDYSTNHMLYEARDLGCFVCYRILVPSTVAHVGLLQQIFVEEKNESDH